MLRLMTDDSLQIVLFELAGEIYGMGIDIVQEVIRVSEISRVPQTPDFIEGVINLRKFFIPVVDLRKRFGLGTVDAEKSARIMIMAVEEQIIGIVVDRVHEVVTISADSIDPPSPIIRGTIKTDYLLGFTEVNGQLAKILNVEKLFSEKELGCLKEIEETVQE